MLKIILGIIAGFVAWSILWVGSDQVLMLLSPRWYGAHQLEFARAFRNQEPFTADALVLGLNLMRAFVISVLSGLLSAFVAGENRKAPLLLGILLFVIGLIVEILIWQYLPVWYHVAFLLLIIPSTLLGGRLKSVE